MLVLLPRLSVKSACKARASRSARMSKLIRVEAQRSTLTNSSSKAISQNHRIQNTCLAMPSGHRRVISPKIRPPRNVSANTNTRYYVLSISPHTNTPYRGKHETFGIVAQVASEVPSIAAQAGRQVRGQL